MVELKLIKRLVTKYALEQLEKGEHPNDVEFELLDMTAQILDEFGTDEEGGRVDFKDSAYYHEHLNT